MGMNLLPLCTASVCPTNSGSTVQRRAQVLSTRFSPLRLSVSIFRTRESTTYGPFLMERAMWSGSLYFFRPRTMSESLSLRRRGVWPRGVFRPGAGAGGATARVRGGGLGPLGDLAPRRARVPAARGLALPTAHGVVDGIHRDASHGPMGRAHV